MNVKDDYSLHNKFVYCIKRVVKIISPKMKADKLKITDSPKELLPDEMVILRLEKAPMTVYRTLHIHHSGKYSSLSGGKKILVTNKRILISRFWLGFETFYDGLSYFYSREDYDKYKIAWKDSVLTKYNADDNFIELSGFYDVKIYTERNYEIEKIIKENSKELSSIL